ncbi:Arrestin family protein 1 [Wickerhamiella sorbophila]|uniref:Arrestin family protein 1 n=1 Tax=Wickerhamiella sorbophila TaxID=45607 RepID=A0A2T0FDG5_9ASCO|nr:Arrestin family protein 1 [Wickerhamiella sorbophila]PRT53044.1 Arrestin family protein 1 [Wickerhamiella sorbophila]
MVLDVKLKGISNEDLVRGYPGVPGTWPRIKGTIEIRQTGKEAMDKTPLGIAQVSIGLYRTDVINVPSTNPIGNQKEQSYQVTKVRDIYNGSSHDVYALDLPFTLNLPTSRPMPASISLKSVETTYHLFVTYKLTTPSKNPVEAVQFPVRICRFDTLSTFGKYHEPIVRQVTSPDHLVNLHFSTPASCYGPRDSIAIKMKAEVNPDASKARKVRLKRMSIELVQVTKYFVPEKEGNEKTEVEKRTRVAKVSQDFADLRIGEKSHVEDMYITLPEPDLEVKDAVATKERAEIPDEGHVAFTTAATLYKIDFVLVLKARFSHAKDIETVQDVTLCEFDHATCRTHMVHIVQAAELVGTEHEHTSASVYSRPIDVRIQIR